MKKFKDILFFSLLCSVILFFGISIFLFPQSEFSSKENRKLSTAPKISLKGVLNGDYFSDLGDFYKDQLPLRNSLTAIHSLSEISLGKAEINGVIPAEQSTLIALPKYKDTEAIKNNLGSIYSLSSERSLVYVPPRAIDTFKDLLPSVYPYDDLSSSLLNKDTKALFDSFLYCGGSYYRTDHHWTTDGAFLAYNQICASLGIAPYNEDFFIKERVSKDFYGTSFSKSGLPSSLLTPDTITLYRYNLDSSFEVINHETNQSKSGFYSLDALNTTDKYKVFMGGNYSHVSIKSTTEANRPTLLLIKDSFANSLIPFLALHYDIEVIDPRYCTPSFLHEQLQRDDFDYTLFVLSFDTLATKIF